MQPFSDIFNRSGLGREFNCAPITQLGVGSLKILDQDRQRTAIRHQVVNDKQQTPGRISPKVKMGHPQDRTLGNIETSLQLNRLLFDGSLMLTGRERRQVKRYKR